ncbi:MAG: TonB-dependent receptor, partial [Myxococcota bacterium]
MFSLLVFKRRSDQIGPFSFALIFGALLTFSSGLSAAQEQALKAEQTDASRSSDEDQLDLANLLEFTIESASRQKEPLKEAPVPVTVITSEMIRSIGARNLKDVLTAYVPGMTPIIDHNESNVAMRGIYASSQQKILVMIDGRRLNQRAYLAAATGHGISINPDKVAQIEVLRGPGSSVYGNVALSATVNIVTKRGEDIDGMKLRAGGGNFGQIRSDIAYGKTFDEDHELVLYGSFYRASGEDFSVSTEESYVENLQTETPIAGNVVIDGANTPVNYDFGLRYRIGNLTLVAQTRFDKHTEPYTALGRTGDIYDEDELRTVRGVGPGLGMQGSALGASYSQEIVDGFTLTLDVGYDVNSVQSSAASSSNGGGVFFSWDEQALYGILQARYDYTLGGLGDGNILVGAHVDWWRLVDSILVTGTEGELVNVADNSRALLLLTGTESSYSGFFQVKQRLGRSFIVNVGGRLDYKTRRNNTGDFDTEPPEVDDVVVFSPRAAVIFTPTSNFDVKLSFADSFVDSPYWYRYNSLPTYAGAFDLRPEKLRSVQLTPSSNRIDG